MSPFRSFYDNSFDTKCPGMEKKIHCAHIVLYDVGESPPQRHIFYLKINYAEQTGYLKIFMGCVWGNDACGGGGAVALESLSTIKKGTVPLNFQLNEPFLKFLRQRLL